MCTSFAPFSAMMKSPEGMCFNPCWEELAVGRECKNASADYSALSDGAPCSDGQKDQTEAARCSPTPIIVDDQGRVFDVLLEDPSDVLQELLPPRRE